MPVVRECLLNLVEVVLGVDDDAQPSLVGQVGESAQARAGRVSRDRRRGVSRSDVPAEFGPWSSLWRRYDTWAIVLAGIITHLRDQLCDTP